MVQNTNHTSGVWFDGIVIVRVIFGLMLISDGWNVFDDHSPLALFDLLFNVSTPFAEWMRLAAKLVTFAGGIFLIAGLFTTLMGFLLLISFVVVIFATGGPLLTSDKTPLVFALLSLAFFFTGGGRVSIDHILHLNRPDEKRGPRVEITKQFGRYVSKN